MVEGGEFVKKKDSFFCYLEEIFIFAAENAWSSRTGREPFWWSRTSRTGRTGRRFSGAFLGLGLVGRVGLVGGPLEEFFNN